MNRPPDLSQSHRYAKLQAPNIAGRRKRPSTDHKRIDQMKRKLIETPPYLPLDAISVASKRDKDKKTGTIKNVHKWFAPMPTPALRALIFGAVVDVPDDQEEHERLLDLVQRLVPEDGSPPDDRTLEEARAAIQRTTGGALPTIFDPFCGGGSTLIEAQRLGLPAEGSDLNPVPALITRTLTQLIPAVAGRPPLVGNQDELGSIAGGPLDGLLADVKHYAEVVRASVWAQVGGNYPGGPNGETIIAWLWAWTAICPNPACGATMPLVSSLWLSKKKGMSQWLSSRVVNGEVSFEVCSGVGEAPRPAKVGRGAKFRCLVCSEVADEEEIKAYGVNSGLGTQLLAIAVDESGVRSFLPADLDRRAPIGEVEHGFSPELPNDPRAMWCKAYGIHEYADLFLPRQLVLLERSQMPSAPFATPCFPTVVMNCMPIQLRRSLAWRSAS